MANFIELQDMKVYSKKRKILLSGSTNQIIYTNKNPKTLQFLLPIYTRIKINSIAGIDYRVLKAQLHCDLFVTINVTGLEPFLIQYVKKNCAIFFNNDVPLQLNEDNQDFQIYVQEEKQVQKNRLQHHYLHFQIRKVYTTSMIPNVFLTPFQTLDLILSINVKLTNNFNFKQYCKDNPEKLSKIGMVYFRKKGEQQVPIDTIKFGFNSMDCSNQTDKIYPLYTKFGNYRIASNLLKAEYSNQSTTQIIREHSDQINQKNQQKIKQNIDYSQYKPFQVSHFIITIYKNPNSSIVVIFVPLWLLTFVNLGIFYQSSFLAGRIQNIVGLMFAFVAIIPIIRDQIPPNRKITFVQYIVYIITFTTLICLIQSLNIRQSTTFQPKFYDPFFLSSLIVTILSVIIIIIMMILHRAVWKPNYQKEYMQAPSPTFYHLNWSNHDCDKHFLKFFDNRKFNALIFNDYVRDDF